MMHKKDVDLRYPHYARRAQAHCRWQFCSAYLLFVCDRTVSICAIEFSTMPWDEANYPRAMRNLPREVRLKAIEIANALLEQGYEEGKAIRIAIAKAKEWAENRE